MPTRSQVTGLTERAPSKGSRAELAVGAVLWPLVVLIVITMGLWTFFVEYFKVTHRALVFASQLSGAFLTLGGVVVALASIVTLISVEERVRQAFDRAHMAVKEDFELQMNRQMEAHLAFFRSTLAHNWEEAEAQARLAIEKYPTLSGVRSFIGLKMFDAVESVFYLNHVDFDGLMRARPDLDGSPTVEAVKWLEDAIMHDDQSVRCHAALSCLFGILGRSTKMIEHLRELTVDQAKEQLIYPASLIALAHGCLGNEGCLTDTGRKLGISWPTINEVDGWIRRLWQESHQDGFPLYFKWWVMPRPQTNIDARTYPRLLLIRPFTLDGGEAKGNASFWVASGIQNIPQSETGETKAFDELMQDLDARFWFLCPEDPEQTRRWFAGS